MLVEMHKRSITPGLIMFADTGGERPETYDAVAVVDLWCRQRFGIGIEVVRKTYKGSFEGLEKNCRRLDMLPSIAYGYKSCSIKYKVEPQNKYANHWPPAVDCWDSGGKCEKWIGYDAGEERRAKILSDDKYTYRYPLIEWGIFREDCLQICAEAGLPSAKSSCFFCPSMKRHEIAQLSRDHPDLMRRALEMESGAKLTSMKGLGRSFSWKDFLAGNQETESQVCGVSEVPCGCYDGGAE